MTDGPVPGAARLPATPWLVVAALAVAGALVSATTPLRDPDLPWHLDLGRDILDSGRVSDLGGDWSFVHPDRTWITSQWLSEVVLSLMNDVGGLRGVQALRLGVAVVVVLALVRLLLVRRHPLWGATALGLTLVSVAPYLEARPQSLALPLVVGLASLRGHLARTGEPPPWWLVLSTCWLWANLHGSWVLLPAVLVLLALGRLADRRGGLVVPPARPLLARAAGCVAAACLTPAGPALLATPFAIAASAGHLTEWQPTAPWSLTAVTLDVVVVLLLVAWWRGTAPVPPSEVLYVAALVGLALTAQRGIGPAVVLLAPVLLERLTSTFPAARPPDRRIEVLAFRSVAAALLVSGLVTAVARTATTAVVSDLLPVRLAQVIAADGREHRVLHAYDAAGTVLHWGEGRSRVVLDGRVDYYGRAAVAEYVDVLTVRPGWRERVSQWGPDRALLLRDSPLAAALLDDGWEELDRDAHHVLLAPPAAADG